MWIEMRKKVVGGLPWHKQDAVQSCPIRQSQGSPKLDLETSPQRLVAISPSLLSGPSQDLQDDQWWCGRGRVWCSSRASLSREQQWSLEPYKGWRPAWGRSPWWPGSGCSSPPPPWYWSTCRGYARKKNIHESKNAHLSRPTVHAKGPKGSHDNSENCQLGESGVNKEEAERPGSAELSARINRSSQRCFLVKLTAAINWQQTSPIFSSLT